jgi:hypothetical protein
MRKRNDIAFHFIAKKDSFTRSQLTREVCYKAWYDIAQWTSQSTGSTARRPNAPALAQMVASARILSHVPETEGRSPSKTQALRCFQIIQGSSSVIVARPLCIGLGVFCRAVIQCTNGKPTSTGIEATHIPDFLSYMSSYGFVFLVGFIASTSNVLPG